jgi:preprotein translocase subunit YajC
MQEYLLLGQAGAETSNSGQAAPAAPGAEGPGASQTQTQTQQSGKADPNTAAPAKPGGMSMWLPLLLMGVVLYFFMFRGPRKQQKQHQQMLEAMKKGDRVRTIGGIIGTVVDLRDDEVVVKIDEATNTKMRVVRSAISKVMAEGEETKS